MSLRIVQDPPSTLSEYGLVPIAFDIRSIVKAIPLQDAPDEYELVERTVPTPMFKDYDAIPNEGPMAWPGRFDLSSWSFFGAYAGDTRVGSAAVVISSADTDLVETRSDVALLWDLRVAPSARRSGVGSALLHAVELCAAAGGANLLKVETQDINVPACRFYLGHGFRLRTVTPRAYPDLPEETQFLWYKQLTGMVAPTD